MNSQATLKALESMLINFLDEAIALKEKRLKVLSGINELDSIAKRFNQGDMPNAEIGKWLAEHNNWLESPSLKPTDRNRLGNIFGQIQRELHATTGQTPEIKKLTTEISRWTKSSKEQDITEKSGKITLRRGPEIAREKDLDSTIPLFDNMLHDLPALYTQFAQGKKHILSVLDEALKEAIRPDHNDALLLSAFLIYYLKQNGYKVESYVKRLKVAERVQTRVAGDA